MRRFITAAPLIVLTACALSVFTLVGMGILPVSASAGQNETITETIRLSFIKPSAFLRGLREGLESPGPGLPSDPKSLIPSGITDTVPNDATKTLTVTGTTASVSELKQLVRLLDVKPRQVVLKTRLMETRLGQSGVRQRTLLQSSVLSARNNQSVMTVISGMESEKEEIFVTFTPHINSNRTISVLAKMQRRWEDESKLKTYETNAVAVYSKPNEWVTLRTMSFSEDPKIQKIMQASGTPPIAAYPLYRIEVFSTEITN